MLRDSCRQVHNMLQSKLFTAQHRLPAWAAPLCFASLYSPTTKPPRAVHNCITRADCQEKAPIQRSRGGITLGKQRCVSRAVNRAASQHSTRCSGRGRSRPRPIGVAAAVVTARPLGAGPRGRLAVRSRGHGPGGAVALRQDGKGKGAALRCGERQSRRRLRKTRGEIAAVGPLRAAGVQPPLLRVPAEQKGAVRVEPGRAGKSTGWERESPGQQWEKGVGRETQFNVKRKEEE